MVIHGTGHRPDKLGGYGDQAFNTLVKLCTNWLQNPVIFVNGTNTPLLIDEVISGMAIGFDMALATAASHMGIPFIAAVPFKGQEKIWPEKTQILYNTLLKQARTVVYVSDGDYANWKMQRRNEWMSDNSHFQLQLWDGSTGGTYNCVQYAKKKIQPSYNLYSDWLKLK